MTPAEQHALAYAELYPEESGIRDMYKDHEAFYNVHSEIFDPCWASIMMVRIEAATGFGGGRKRDTIY